MNKLVSVTIIYLAVSVCTKLPDDYVHTRDQFSFNELTQRNHQNLYDETFETDNELRESGSSPFEVGPKAKPIENRKPMIMSCEEYALLLEEESVPGTFVTQIKAIDPDDHQTIVFSFVAPPTERTMFAIDKYTGRITSVHRFDCDEPIREKMTYITVRATDNGSPALDDVCTFKVTIEDINDNAPMFDKATYVFRITTGAGVGSRVGSVSAYDLDDGDNSIIKFDILKRSTDHDYFRINETNGIITLSKPIDKSPGESYQFIVRAYNIIPGFALVQDDTVHVSIRVLEGKQVHSELNEIQHAPIFESNFFTTNVAEDTNINTRIMVVAAPDVDTSASQISYSITSGNKGNAFRIDETTGAILVNEQLDYETITQYTLTVRLVGGTYDRNVTVLILVENVNDNPPRFAMPDFILKIDEEKLMEGCIETIQAWDPDIESVHAPQHIRFAIVKVDQQALLEIDDTGCLRQKVPLDRDPLNGRKAWQVIISATDEDGRGWQSTTTLNIILNDINDKSPYLTNDMPVIWYENQGLGSIITLTADDYDAPHNGPPFHFELSDSANDDIKSKFRIYKDVLYAMVDFDREEQKEYFIPIRITDSGEPQSSSNISVLHLVIGDVNDNKMSYGESYILVYNYERQLAHAAIGRVYVVDSDDWDRSDKRFRWKANVKNSKHFALNRRTGMIKMLPNTRPGDYELYVTVTEKSNFFPEHSVSAKVVITVKDISEEAINNSGSIRFYGITAKEFVSVTPALSSTPKDRLLEAIAEIFNITADGVNIFTVLQQDNNATYLDVRFNVLVGKAYYKPEKINVMMGYHQKMLEELLGLPIMMIDINECINEKLRCDLSSCRNVLHKSKEPVAVYTNTSSFVGVNAFVRAECTCEAPLTVNDCLNGGNRSNDECECHEGYEGPNCEDITVGFYGDGYAMYPPVDVCNITSIKMGLSPQRKDGLVLYIGPLVYNPLLPASDFLALELVEGLPTLLLNYGIKTIRIVQNKHRFLKGRPFTVEIVLQPEFMELIICDLWNCITSYAPKDPNESLNAPLQLGGSAVDLESLGFMFNWTYIPQNKGFTGCLRNLTINDRTYDLGAPVFAENHDPGCRRSVVAVSELSENNLHFLIASILCILILIILLLVMVAHKKLRACWGRKLVANRYPAAAIRYEADRTCTRTLAVPPIVMPEVSNIDYFLTNMDNMYPHNDNAYEDDEDSFESQSSDASSTDEYVNKQNPQVDGGKNKLFGTI